VLRLLMIDGRYAVGVPSDEEEALRASCARGRIFAVI